MISITIRRGHHTHERDEAKHLQQTGTLPAAPSHPPTYQTGKLQQATKRRHVSSIDATLVRHRLWSVANRWHRNGRDVIRRGMLTVHHRRCAVVTRRRRRLPVEKANVCVSLSLALLVGITRTRPVPVGNIGQIRTLSGSFV